MSNNPYGSINNQQSSSNIPSAYQNSNSFPSVPSSVPNNVPSYATINNNQYTQSPTTPTPPVNQNIPAYASINPSTQNYNNSTPSYATINNNNQYTQSTPTPTPPTPAYATLSQFPSVPQTKPTANQSFQANYNNKQVNNNPSIDPNTPSYISGVYPTNTGSSSPYSSPKPSNNNNKIQKFDSLSDLYASSKQTSYMNNQQASAKIASESLRKSVQKEKSIIINDDGSIEGWLWQQSKSGSWDRLYFILDNDKLLGFSHYPQKDEFVSPIHALPLKTGMLVSILQVSYLGVNGNCFAVQIKPNSSNVVMFDSLSKDDRETWVNYLEKATKADQVSAWIPWEMENKQALLQKEQELLQEQQREEQRLEYEKEKKIKEQVELVRKQELAKLENSNIAGYIQTSYNQENTLKNIEQVENRLRDETKELSAYKEQCQSSNDSTEAIDASIKERESKLQELETEKQKQMITDSSNNIIHEKSFELEIERIKKEQEEILKREEERIRAELTAQFEKETQLLRQQQEEKLKLERQEQKRKAKDQEIAQVRKWLQENQSWAEYYKNLGVTEEELQDPACLKLIKKLIKDTAQYVIKSGISNDTSTPNTPDISSSSDNIPNIPNTPDISATSDNTPDTPSTSDNIPNIPNTPDTPSTSDNTPDIPSTFDNISNVVPDTSCQSENTNQDTNISSDSINIEDNSVFDALLPARPPPPPPSDDEEEDNIIQVNIPSPPNPAPPIPQENINNTVEESNIKVTESLEVTESPEITNSNPIPPPPTNVPPPPSIPPPPIPTAPILNIKRTDKQNTKVNESKQSNESMMDSITNFKFAEKKEGDKVKQNAPPLKKEQSMLAEIQNFKFSERKAVPTITQLPKQKQDSLTALLSDQLTIFRSKLREDQLDDDDDEEEDDYWD